MSVCKGSGRFGNYFIRSVATSIIAEKFNLSISYDSKYEHNIIELGINLFNGTNEYKTSIHLCNKNFIDIYNNDSIHDNIISRDYLQQKDITSLINCYLNKDKVKNRVIESNKFKHRYRNNNDCFIHVRLGDVEKYNPGFQYYDKILSKLQFDTLYIGSDSPNSIVIKQLLQKYTNAVCCEYGMTDTILFGSTCKHVVLSYGTFSSTIGYFSFYSYVYPVPYTEEYAWDWGKDCDTISDKYSLLGPWIYNL